MTSMLENIRIKAGEYLLKKQLGNRKRNVVFRNLSKIKTAGIIFEAIPKENIALVKHFVAELKKFGITTKALGYANEHRKNLDLIGSSSFTYVCKDDYSFFYDTKDDAVKSFTDEPLDLLVVYCENDLFPLKHIATLSKAELKDISFLYRWRNGTEVRTPLYYVSCRTDPISGWCENNLPWLQNILKFRLNHMGSDGSKKVLQLIEDATTPETLAWRQPSL